ncbi:MAG: hypothetical protein E7425_08330 [Ruminococcaceae bacterium]|nr:hypothetical protein [Oscillospiraceae bacterium]
MIYGSNNWKLSVKRGTEGVTILRALTCDARAALPDALFGMPVTALGDRALAAGASITGGEEIDVIGAPAAGEWDNQALRELTLSPLLCRAGDYALMNCRALETIRLTDRPIVWGTGALMNCRALRHIEITRSDGSAGDAAAYFSGELSCELDISVLSDGRRVSRVILPEYYEEYVENSPAHHFDYKVHGAGQPYHHVFRDRQLRLDAYDALWQKLISGEYEPDTALRLAFWRVCCPEGLGGDAGARYRQYLAAHADDALRYALSLRDVSPLCTLLKQLDFTAEVLRAAADLAREERDTAAVAVLLEELHRRAGAEKSFEL